MGLSSGCLSHITVEPVIFFFFWSIPYISHGNGVLLFNYFCNADFNATYCGVISTPEFADGADNHQIQGKVSRWIMYSTIIMVIPMMYSTTILGAISDRFQRKLPMIMPFVGVFASCLWSMGVALVPGINISRYFLVSSFLIGITGYYGAAVMSTSAYLGVMTTATNRTWRISVFESALTLGLVIGSVTSGVIIDHIGVAAIYGFAAGLNLIAIAYTAGCVAETHRVKPERSLWYELCNLSHVKDYIKTVYKPRTQSRRLYIHILFASFVVGTCAHQGLYDVLFLYLTKSRNFTNPMFSAFKAGQALLQCVGNIFVMYIVKKRWDLSEPIINLISAAGTAISFSMIAASNTEVIWASLAFMLISGLGGGACRGFLSKLVPQEEQGQVFAFIGMGQCMTSLLASVVFNNIYPYSLAFWDGLCAFLAGMMNVVGVGLALAVFIHRKVHNHSDEQMNLLPPPNLVSMTSSVGGQNTMENIENSSDEDDSLPVEDIVRLPLIT